MSERESREMNVMHHTVQQIAMGMLTKKESSNVVIPVFSPKSIPIIGTTAKTTEATLLSTLTLEKMIFLAWRMTSGRHARARRTR